MTEQERKIVKLLLNEMAFEGAMKHFDEPVPDIPSELLEEIKGIDIPKRYDGNTESYENVAMEFPNDWGVFDCCYKCLRIIRNNIVHANKAYRPDTPKRLTELLNWSEAFIDAVYANDTPFSQRAAEIKIAMKIESF